MSPQVLSNPGILYLVQDLSDPAVRRRVMMLQAGGAVVSIAGFNRSSRPVASLEGRTAIDTIELGQTENGNFWQRIIAVTKSALTIGGNFGHLAKPDVIVARNLEMLVVAMRLRAYWGAPDLKIVYECLDIHRLMLRQDLVGNALRRTEKHLLQHVSLVITSSPGFVRNYFNSLASITQPIEIVENKHIELAHPSAAVGSVSAHSADLPRPWKIGWFGALRCKRSLEVMARFTQEQKGNFEIVLRGIPSLDVFPEFHEFVDAQPHMSYKGRYKNPEDLSAIYQDVHFSWVIDLFEAGQNSAWLLPNRLYEGCRFSAVPIAVKNTETAEFLSSIRIGITIDELSSSELSEALSAISDKEFDAHKNAVASIPKNRWVCDLNDCQNLVSKIAGAPATGHFSAQEFASPISLERI